MVKPKHVPLRASSKHENICYVTIEISKTDVLKLKGIVGDGITFKTDYFIVLNIQF